MFSGSASVKMNNNGRIRIPSLFRKVIEEAYGNEVFVMSFDGKTVEIYPLLEWTALSVLPDEKSKDPAVRKFLLRANSNGMTTKIDKRKRIPLPKWLGDRTGLEGEIAVEGERNRLVLKRKRRIF